MAMDKSFKRMFRNSFCCHKLSLMSEYILCCAFYKDESSLFTYFLQKSTYSEIRKALLRHHSAASTRMRDRLK